MKKTLLVIGCASMATLMLSGCARQISPGVYTEAHVGETSRTYRCTVVSVRTVEVHGKEKLEENAAGGLLGAAGGGLAGSAFGKGRGHTAAIVGGALAGAVAGSLLQGELEKQQGTEYVVELENGRLRTVVQGPTPALQVGQDALLIIGDKGRSRLVADNNPHIYKGNRAPKRKGVERREVVVKHAPSYAEEDDY
jgi:outer membrane lipoprotein SlyB